MYNIFICGITREDVIYEHLDSRSKALQQLPID